MNILFYCKDFYPMQNGYANAYRNLLSSIVKNGEYKITVITTTPLGNNPELDINNLNVIRARNKFNLRFFRFFLNSFSLAKFINSLCKKQKYDLVFFESGDDPLIIANLDENVLSKTVVRYHSTSDTEYTEFFPGILNKINKFLQHRILPKKVINYCSTNDYHIEFIKEKFLKSNEYLISQKRFFNLPNTLGEFDEKIINKELKVREKEIFILGRLNPEGYYQKGFADVVDVLKNITVKQLNGYRIFILGDGKFFDNLNEKIKQLPIKNRITLVRRLPHEEVIQKLEKCTAVVLPSRFEGHSMFALEAIGCGAIPIFSDAGALKEMTPISELQFKSQDSYMLLSRIIDCVNMDDNELVIKSQECTQWYLDKYSSVQIKAKFDYIFKVLNG